MDAEKIEFPITKAEDALFRAMTEGVILVSSKIENETKAKAFGVMIVIYDCIGMGVREIAVRLDYGTVETLERFSAPEEEKWNPSFWNNSGELIESGTEVLKALDIEFEGKSIDEDERVIKFWNLVAGWTKTQIEEGFFLKNFPNADFVLIGNGAGDGATATTLINPNGLPDYIWTAGLG